MLSGHLIDLGLGALTPGARARGANHGRLNGAQREGGQLRKSRGVPLAR